MWRSRPVFISSTFADMQAERDYLRTRVFPELEERLRARRHNLEWVDLRVGVATASQPDESVRELHVLKVCLDEVRRCRPFLIVLLGDRYGWVPPADRIKAAAEEAREGFSADIGGRSVTDLEIEFGVLSDPEQQPRSFFYFREPLPYADMPAEIAALYCEDYATDGAKAERKQRLDALKRRIEKRLPGRVAPYRVAWDNERQRATGLEDFGRMVLEHIWSELEAETKTSVAAPDITWQQTERDALEDFIDDRARDFVGREAMMASLLRLCLSPRADGAPWGACITGDPGSGKSALFGALHRRLVESDVLLLAHAPGASVAAPSVDSMLRRWIAELAVRSAAIPSSPKTPTLKRWRPCSRGSSGKWRSSDASSCWSTRSINSRTRPAAVSRLGCRGCGPPTCASSLPPLPAMRRRRWPNVQVSKPCRCRRSMRARHATLLPAYAAAIIAPSNRRSSRGC